MDMSLLKEVNKYLGLVGYEIDEVERCLMTKSSGGNNMASVTLDCSHYNNDNTVHVMVMAVEDGKGGYTVFGKVGPTDIMYPNQVSLYKLRRFVAQLIATEVDKESGDDEMQINMSAPEHNMPEYSAMLYEYLHDIMYQRKRVQTLEITMKQYNYSDSTSHESLFVRCEVNVPWTGEMLGVSGMSYNNAGMMSGIVNVHRFNEHGTDMNDTKVVSWHQSWDCSTVDEMLFKNAADMIKELLQVSVA